jgi:HEAT repeat protein
MEFRRRVIFALGKSGDKSAVAPLLNCLENGELDVRCIAARALCDLSDIRGQTAFKGYLLSPELKQRSEAMNAFL